MSAQFIELDSVEWRKVQVLGKYELTLPRPLSDWDVFPYWERARFDSMAEHLRPGMTLFDVGTEQGWCNLIYAQFVGPENMVLIEPTTEFWPNIRRTWEQNFGDTPPMQCWDGLFSDVTTTPRAPWYWGEWPECTEGPLIDRNKYQYIHDHTDDIPETQLDNFVARGGTVPAAITMDVEGAELLVLHGAEQTLATHRPLVWVSVHPDMSQRDYGFTDQDLHDFMADMRYAGEHLSTDHEEHWFYRPV